MLTFLSFAHALVHVANQADDISFEVRELDVREGRLAYTTVIEAGPWGYVIYRPAHVTYWVVCQADTYDEMYPGL